MARILVTGSKGFVGSHLVSRLLADGHRLNLADRSINPRSAPSSNIEAVAVGEIHAQTDWSAALAGCDAVIHLAGQTGSSDPRNGRCDEVNNLGTQRLAGQAAAAGIRTFIFLSSVMALADNSSPSILNETSVSTATSAYGLSKLRAEQHVVAFAVNGRRGVNLRPPMIYGLGAKGNWRRLQELASTGLPLPFALVDNRRSLISIGNLVDAIANVVASGADGPSGTHLISDGGALSLAGIITLLREGASRPRRLLPVPVPVLQTGLRFAGMAAAGDSLLGNLAIDDTGFRTIYGWAPLETTQDAIRATAAAQA